ncbi:MAG: (2Fe-2S)-binding protein [Rhodothermales bacterium]
MNGVQHPVEVAPFESLAHLLRERLRLTGTKLGCQTGACGSCTVLVDGRLKNACITLAALTDGCEITTIEGLAQGEELHPVQEAFVACGAIQCGYCTPGMVLASVALLNENPAPTDAEIREAISGNICRCTGYTKIIEAVKQAALAIQNQAACE